LVGKANPVLLALTPPQKGGLGYWTGQQRLTYNLLFFNLIGYLSPAD